MLSIEKLWKNLIEKASWEEAFDAGRSAIDGNDSFEDVALAKR
jgi:hypothetical protein